MNHGTDPLESDNLSWSDQSDWLDASHMDTEAEVSCPYCGEEIEIAIDPSGGSAQEYVQDCEVCCRPWRVQVHYGTTGSAEVVVATI